MPTTIAIDPKTRERLRRFGMAGMSYDEILQQLMDRVEKDQTLKELQRVADNETDWVELDDFDWGE